MKTKEVNMRKIRTICKGVAKQEYNKCLYLCMKMYPYRMKYRRYNAKENLYSLYWNMSDNEFEELIQEYTMIRNEVF